MTDVSIMEKNNRTEQRRDKVCLVIPLLFPHKLNQYVGYFGLRAYLSAHGAQCVLREYTPTIPSSVLYTGLYTSMAE